MSAQPVTRERQPRHLVADAPQSLDALASTANREHELCESATQAAYAHALRAGDALLAARKQLEPGEWMGWLLGNFNGSQSAASNYMRIATYKDRVQPGMGVKAAVAALRGLPDVTPTGPPRLYDDSTRTAAVTAIEGGATYEDVARRVGVSASTIYGWKHPHKRREQKARAIAQRRAAAAALAKAERDKAIRSAVRKAGAALAEAYSMTARMSGVLTQAEQEATSEEARAALEDARTHYHKMSDAIVRALGVS